MPRVSTHYYLAQVNIARMRYVPSDPRMDGLTSRIAEINALADRSPGFVWRLPGSLATAEALEPFRRFLPEFDAGRLFYNLSVWQDVESLRAYIYDSPHREMLRGRHAWVEPFEVPGLALWWIPSGERPRIEDSLARLQALHERGPTEFAFSLANPFPAPVRHSVTG